MLRPCATPTEPTLEPGNHDYWATGPSYWRLRAPESALHNKRSHRNEKPAAATAAKLLQSRPTLCDPIDGSPPGSAVPGILQARTLEWVAISSSNAWKWKVKMKSLSRVRLLATPWTAAYQAPPSMGFSRQEYWSGVPLPSPNEKPTQPQLESSLRLSQLEKSLHSGEDPAQPTINKFVKLKKNKNSTLLIQQ